MATSGTVNALPPSFTNTLINGDCIQVMRQIPAQSVDFILTDPPYLVNLRDRSGRTLQNDTDSGWLKPAMAQAHRLLKNDSLMLCFYGWSRANRFIDAWNDAGFRLAGHMVFVKRYASKTRFLRYQHEQAYLLAKGNPSLPSCAISDVQSFEYTGNALHPTQKPLPSLARIIQAFTRPGDLVLDCFCGSVSTCAAALLSGRRFLGIELDAEYFRLASARIERIKCRIAPPGSLPTLSIGLELQRDETRKGHAGCHWPSREPKCSQRSHGRHVRAGRANSRCLRLALSVE
jgi:site-specific DNA-methyltransferase (adenine-specific)